jgi:hypothetical protein
MDWIKFLDPMDPFDDHLSRDILAFGGDYTLSMLWCSTSFYHFR